MQFFGVDTDLWFLIGRLGEAGIALPVALALGIWLLASARSVRFASSWFVPLGLAIFVTTVSKVAFLGWGIGVASINFTGFSGHAMFAAAIYPMFAHALTHPARGRFAGRWHGAALVASYLLALLVAISRVKTGAHSYSEACLGFALGATASACALWLTLHAEHRLPGRWICFGMGAWLLAMPINASPSNTHSIVTQLALTLSQRSAPYQRSDLLRQRQGAPTVLR